MPKLCECGCGEATAFATQTRSERGQVKGEPVAFISGHNRRGQEQTSETRLKIALAKHGALNPNWKGDSVGYKAAHQWLAKHHPKSGTCEGCQEDVAGTEYAFLGKPGEYTRNRDDYVELCRLCHVDLDRLLRKLPRLTEGE